MNPEILFLVVALAGAFMIGVVTAWAYFSHRNKALFAELDQSSLALDKSLHQLNEVQKSMHSLRGQLQEQRNQNATLKDQFKDLERKLMLSSPAVFTDTVPNPKLTSELGLSIFNEVPPEDRDELTRVEGISHFLETKLNDLGIRTFAQLASLTDDQIFQLNEAIECFPGRIREEKWVEQCRELSKAKARKR